MGVSDVGLAKVCRRHHFPDYGESTGARRKLAVSPGNPNSQRGQLTSARNPRPSRSTPLDGQVSPLSREPPSRFPSSNSELTRLHPITGSW